MTGYGAPPSPQQSGARQPAESGRPVASPPPVFDLVGAFLGLVVFVLGFVPWYGTGADIKGYYVGSAAPAVIGLSVLAAAVAAGGLLEKPARSTVVPLGASIAALLLVFGMLVAKGDNIDVKIGLILTLILAFLQVVAFALGWLQANGRIMVPKPRSASPWGSPQYGYQGSPQPSYPPPPGYGQAPYGQPPSYGQAPFGQPPSYGQSTSAWTPPQPGYRQPQGPGPGQPQPGQQPPGQHQVPPQPGQQPGQPPPPRPGSYGQSAPGGQPPYSSNPAYGQPPSYVPPAPPPGQSGTSPSYGQTQVFPPSRPQQPGQQPGQQSGQQPGQQPNQSPGQEAGERPGERPGPSS